MAQAAAHVVPHLRLACKWPDFAFLASARPPTRVLESLVSD
jgi:hypothetical protein